MTKTFKKLAIEIDFPTANPLAKSSLELLLLTAMPDTDVPSGSLVLLDPCQKKGSLSPQMTLLSEKRKSEWKKERCLVAGKGRIHVKRVMMTFQIFRE